MRSHLLVERALALVPDSEDFLPLKEAVMGISEPDREKAWARSGLYSTVGKRVVNPARVGELIPSLLERAQRRLNDLFTLVVRAIEQEQKGDSASAAEALVRAGELEERDRRLREADAIYRLALELAQNLRDKGPQILALRRLGRVARGLGRLDEAWALYESSYRLGIDQGDLAGQVIACQGLGNVCDDRGQRDLSRVWYERGLDLALQLDRADLIWPFHTNLAVVSLHSGSLAAAETHLARARAAIERAGDASAMMFWYNNQGLVLLEIEDGRAAEGVYREALEHAADPFWEMVLRLNLSRALILQDRLLEAGEAARRAEEVAILHRFIPSLVDVYDVLGSIARARRDGEGFVFYEQALAVYRERGLPRVREAFIYRGYGLLQRECGHPDEARAYLERARDLYGELGLEREMHEAEAELTLLPAPG